jgi:hypothetical protein
MIPQKPVEGRFGPMASDLRHLTRVFIVHSFRDLLPRRMPPFLLRYLIYFGLIILEIRQPTMKTTVYS